MVRVLHQADDAVLGGRVAADPGSLLPMPTSPAAELINTIDPPALPDCGRDRRTCTVEDAGELTSITSRQPSSPACIIAIPALATTMSSRRSRPACNARPTVMRDQRRPCLATILPFGVLDELDGRQVSRRCSSTDKARWRSALADVNR